MNTFDELMAGIRKQARDAARLKIEELERATRVSIGFNVCCAKFSEADRERILAAAEEGAMARVFDHFSAVAQS